MTGLNPDQNVILQAALVVTNSELKSLEEASFDLRHPEQNLLTMSPFVRDMHENSGLLRRSRASRVECRDAERGLLERISGWCTFPAVIFRRQEHWARSAFYRALHACACRILALSNG